MRALVFLGVAVFVTCLLGGIGYVLAVLKWSDEPVATVRNASGEGTATEALTLSPDMNPLRAALDARYSQTLGSARLYATVSLRMPEGQTAWTRRLRISTSGEGGIGGSMTVSMPAERFDVPTAGRYTVELRLDDDTGASFRSAEVQIRRNVRVLNWVWIGALAVAGALGMGVALGANAIREVLGRG